MRHPFILAATVLTFLLAAAFIVAGIVACTQGGGVDGAKMVGAGVVIFAFGRFDAECLKDMCRQ